MADFCQNIISHDLMLTILLVGDFVHCMADMKRGAFERDVPGLEKN